MFSTVCADCVDCADYAGDAVSLTLCLRQTSVAVLVKLVKNYKIRPILRNLELLGRN